MSIREAYVNQGVDKYYQEEGEIYRNPHENIVQGHLNHLIQMDLINSSESVLDLCCGSGEVSLFLKSKGFKDVMGCDPYTQINYFNRTGLKSMPYNFKEIAQGNITQKFDVIICSFALHLAPVSLLPTILYQLSMISNKLVIISPHKKPDIKDFWDLTNVFYDNKVYSKFYEILNYD